MKPVNVFPYDSNIDFMRMRWVSLSIAFLLMVVALGAMGTRSFNSVSYTHLDVYKRQMQEASLILITNYSILRLYLLGLAMVVFLIPILYGDRFQT